MRRTGGRGASPHAVGRGIGAMAHIGHAGRAWVRWGQFWCVLAVFGLLMGWWLWVNLLLGFIGFCAWAVGVAKEDEERQRGGPHRVENHFERWHGSNWYH